MLKSASVNINAACPHRPRPSYTGTIIKVSSSRNQEGGNLLLSSKERDMLNIASWVRKWEETGFKTDVKDLVALTGDEGADAIES